MLGLTCLAICWYLFPGDTCIITEIMEYFVSRNTLYILTKLNIVDGENKRFLSYCKCDYENTESCYQGNP